jgi:hypothetical protein
MSSRSFPKDDARWQKLYKLKIVLRKENCSKYVNVT